MAQEVVALRDQLHVRVLDPVVHHLHVVAGAVRAHVCAAGGAIDLCGDRLEDRPHRLLVGSSVAARHDARPEERALLTTGHAGADKVHAACADRLVAALRVAEVRVAAVDEDVAGIEVRKDLLDHRIGRGAGLHHDHQHTRPRERTDPIGDGIVAGQRALAAVFGHERFGATGGPVVDGDGDVVVGDVAREVRAHRCQAREAEMGFRGHCAAA